MLPIRYIKARALIFTLVLLFWIALGNFWPDIYAHPAAWLGLMVLLAVLLCAGPHAARLRQLSAGRIRNLLSPGICGGAIALIFALLVAAGISGSSLSLGTAYTPFLDLNPARILGKDRPIRSDEWMLFTPMALGQAVHQPAFPVINRNLGIDGQNMLVVGMAGMPVAHISALAKPATWGFFLFDQRRALAWYWWFPIFGCLFALWGVFCLLIPRRWPLALALAAWFGLSAYPAAWSYWPAYAVFFPSTALCALILILRGQRPWRLALLSAALGLALAGFFFILYPPWQVPLAWLYLLLATALIVRDALYRHCNFAKLAALGFALVIAGTLVWHWWADAQQAVQLMLNTDYPGKRIELGGRMPLPWLLRGITNIVSLYRLKGPSNQSEVASFVYLFVPLLAAIVPGFGATRPARAVQTALIVTAGFAFVFMIFGIPQSIARWSLWGMVAEGRADLVLGLAYCMLCGLAIGARRVVANATWRRQATAHALAMLWAALIVIALRHPPANISLGLSPGIETVLFIAVWLGGVWLIEGDAPKFMALNLAWAAMTILPFNPVIVAPKAIHIAPQLQPELQAVRPFSPNRARVLVIGDGVGAMFLLAGGVPVVNGVFYYPQFALWHNWDPQRKHSGIYNRFHHLDFEIGVADYPNGVYAYTPYQDVVRVVVDPQRFHFPTTGAQLLVAPVANAEQLQATPGLHFIRQVGGQAWFQVEPDL
jgi:hypothetical protein